MVFDDSLERSALHFGGYQGGSVSKSESLRSEQLSVTGTAMDFLVWSIASQHRIQWSVAFVTVEALFVPHGTLGKLLFSSEYHSTATWATLTGRSLDAGRIDGNRWLLGGHLLFSVTVSFCQSTLTWKKHSLTYVMQSVCKNPDPQANP